MRRRSHHRFATAAIETLPGLTSIPGRLRAETMDNGLTVCLVENRQAPLVTSAVFYRVGTRDEPAGRGGIAHFLEHMMFKGSAHYGPGEIDRRTQALGGSNNAFTSHDITAYYFNFASDRWTEALTIEADRMTTLRLDPPEVSSERQVILEEIAMYDSEPWDALEMEVMKRLFGSHAYGKPVLGTKEELLAMDERDLRAFHQRFYRPDNAVLVVAGDVGDDAFGDVERILGSVPPGAERRRGFSPPAPGDLPGELARIERRKGEVARILIALPGPPATHPDHPVLKLALTLLGGGRISRLPRVLVEEEQMCVWVSADLSESLDASQIIVAAEVVPGVEPARVEARILELLAELETNPPSAEELERARQIATADWVFGHEKVHQQALSVGIALTLFDLEHLDRHLAGTLAAGPAQVLDVAARYLRPQNGGVLGWSLPKS